jgi:hypothetical protein
MPNFGEPVAIAEMLYRRYFAKKPRQLVDGLLPHSRIFKARDKDEGKLSMDVKSLTTPEASVGNSVEWALFELSNEHVLQIPDMQGTNLQSIHDPLPNAESAIENPAHCLVFHVDPDDDITPKMLAKIASRVQFPDSSS